MKLQSSHSEEVELRLSQSDDIDVRGEVSQESSLIPRLFPPPVFHHFQYVKMEGEGLGERLVCDVGRCDDRCGGNVAMT